MLFTDEFTNVCEGCNHSAGIAFKFTYHSKDNTKGFFSQLFEVPPKLEFGLPTQFSCPMDVFMFLNSSMKVEALSYKSTCINLHLGLFPFRNVETVVYIFETCKLTRYCEGVNFANMTTMVIWSSSLEPFSHVKLGHFMELLPASSNNKSLLVATVSKEKYKIEAKLFSVKLSIFDAITNTMAFINEHELTASFSMMLFNMYPILATIKVEQTDSWEKASLFITGDFNNTANNIPSKLEFYIKDYLEILYNRSVVNTRNAELVYNNSLMQQTSSIENHENVNKSKALTDMLYQKAFVDLNNQLNAVNNIEVELQDASEETLNLQRMIDNLCTIRQCEEICSTMPQCNACSQDVGTLLQSQCSVSCTERITVTRFLGYRTRYRYVFVWRTFCGSFELCFLFWCFRLPICTIRGVCVSTSYMEPQFEEVEVGIDELGSIACTRPCPAEYIIAPVMSTCCGDVGCTPMQDDNCASENDECRSRRGTVYSELARAQNANAEALERYDDAKEQETALRLRLAQLSVRKNNIDQKYNESTEILSEANLAVELASTAYNKVQNESNLDQFKTFKTSRYERPMFELLKIKHVTFNTTLISESPKVLQMLVTGSIKDSQFNFTQAITVDFNRLEGSLRDGAIEISEESILNQDHRLRRSLRYRRESEKNLNADKYYQFQVKCTDLQNVIEYVMNFNETLQVLQNVTLSSVNNVLKGRQELVDMINYYTTEYNRSVIINITEIRETFNIVVNTSETNVTETYAGLSVEEMQNLNIMKEHLNASDGTEIKNEVVFLKWQHKMEQLHNTTSSAAGHNCIGFTDCLLKITGVTEDILMDTPREISDASLKLFPRISQDLIDLSLLQNSDLHMAIQAVTNFLNLISNEQLLSYWCAKLPVIVNKSELKITPHENTTIELFCKSNSTDYTTYRWKKDGIELPQQRSSTLIVHNARLHDDSGNYTCEITNQVGTVESTGTVVDVQQLPWFFLQPENVGSYDGDTNNAIFQSNATGWPYPGFKWFFRCLGCANYTQIPNEDENELVISNPHHHHEGSYYCEAVNEQGSVRSRIVNFTVLDVTVLQLSQSFFIDFTSIDESGSGYDNTRLENGSGSGNETNRSGLGKETSKLQETTFKFDMTSSGSGANNFSDNNVTMTKMQENSGSGFPFQFKTDEEEYVKDQLKKTLLKAVNFTFNSIENISMHNISSSNLSVSFTVYSVNISYSPMSQESLSRRSLQARIDWKQASERVLEFLTTTSIVLTYGNVVYASEPNSSTASLPRYTCPAGKQVSSIKNFLCGELVK